MHYTVSIYYFHLIVVETEVHRNLLPKFSRKLGIKTRFPEFICESLCSLYE